MVFITSKCNFYMFKVLLFVDWPKQYIYRRHWYFLSPGRDKSSVSPALKTVLSWVTGRVWKEREYITAKNKFVLYNYTDFNVGTFSLQQELWSSNANNEIDNPNNVQATVFTQLEVLQENPGTRASGLKTPGDSNVQPSLRTSVFKHFSVPC